MLEMSGTLMLDADRLSHVHARFPGEIVELGPGDRRSPAVCSGQRVHKGQLLAVIWSRDLGEKKSDLIDALSQLRVDEDSLSRISTAAAEGSVPKRNPPEDTRRKVEADRIAIRWAVRTLASWRFPGRRSTYVRAEAERVSGARKTVGSRGDGLRNGRSLKCSSPLDGTVIDATWPSATWSTRTSICSRLPISRGCASWRSAYEDEHCPRWTP